MLCQVIPSLNRKARQIISDPVLRRWLAGRLLGRRPGEPAFAAHRPPYLDGVAPLEIETSSETFPALAEAPPTAPVDLELAGETVSLRPGGEKALFGKDFADVETLLSLHRFAWLALVGDDFDPAWVGAIWTAWREIHATPDDSWAWHPYTAAERAVNVLRFARVHGLPGPIDETLDLLRAHAPAIAERLEYFGEHHTSNHLANNGRGLFLLGLWLGLEKAADLGGRILIEEGRRIFTPMGLLREGSSHYHLLAARNYDEVRREAQSHGRPEAAALAEIADRALENAASLMLPGGFPLIGDISPDLPPARLLEETAGRMARAGGPGVRDGWLRFDTGAWAGLWHAPPRGWSPMPGHGHQDMGSFELHYGSEPVFIDPGRGAYGEGGEAAFYRSAKAHSGLTVDGAEPYPPNRPYYDETFRDLIGGPPPVLSARAAGVELVHHGFARLSGVGRHRRTWRFEENHLLLDDHLEGAGKHRLTRRLITSLEPETAAGGILLKGKNRRYRLGWSGKVAPGLEPITRWHAYGRGTPATAIVIKSAETLPFSGSIILEAL